MENKINVLLTGAGAPGGPGIIKCILENKKRYKLFICDADSNAAGRYLIPSRFNKIPMANENNFIKELLEICLREKIKIIFPLVTKELIVLSRLKDEFRKYGISIIVSSFETLNILNDKGLLYEYLSKKNIKIPKFFFINSDQELINNIKKLNFPDYPVVIKPRISNGSRGVRILDNNIDSFNLLFESKPTSLYTNLKEYLKIIKDKKVPPLILSEFLPGNEITVDTLISKGELKLILIRTREKMNSGISVKGKFIKNKNIKNYIEKIIKTFNGLEGAIGFQLKESNSGDYLLLECNPRIQGTSVSSSGLDINFPLLILDEATNNNYKITNKTYGISFSRFYDQIYYES